MLGLRRPEWAALGRQPGERAASYEQRLKGMFSFSSAATLRDPRARVTIVPARKPPAAAAKSGTAAKPAAKPLLAASAGAQPAACSAVRKPAACDVAAAAAAAAVGKLPDSRKRPGAPLRASLLARRKAALGALCSAASGGGGVTNGVFRQPAQAKRPEASLLRSGHVHGDCPSRRDKWPWHHCKVSFAVPFLNRVYDCVLARSWVIQEERVHGLIRRCVWHACAGGCSKCRHKPGGCAACNSSFNARQVKAEPVVRPSASAHGQAVEHRRKRA